MGIRKNEIFTTDQVTALLGLEPTDKWRVIKFAKSEEYGIRPSLGEASGSGTRRLYDIENVCEIALALRLLETGLRSKAIGRVIAQLRCKQKLSAQLALDADECRESRLAIFRTPRTGRPLDEKRPHYVKFVQSFEDAGKTLERRDGDDLILVPVGLMFSGVKERLEKLGREN